MVTILGAGISGLIAARALEELGVQFRIIDRGPADSMPRLVRGCVYFHDRCGLPASAVREQHLFTDVLPYIAVEPPEFLYHLKVWGHRPYIRNSVESLIVSRNPYSTVYSMNDALTYLTDRYWKWIEWRAVTMDEVLRMKGIVISTIPFPLLAPFARCESTPLYIFQAPAGVGEGADAVVGNYGYVLYNVDPHAAWYRMANMFGNFSIEFTRPVAGWPVEKYAKIITSPDAEPFMQAHPNILLTGRWGRWQRGRLGHETYHEVKGWVRGKMTSDV